MVEYDPDYPENPPVDNIDVEDTVGIDLGITRFSHNSERRAFVPLDEDSDRERTEKRHRSLSRTDTSHATGTRHVSYWQKPTSG